MGNEKKRHKRRDAIAVIRQARNALRTAQFGLADLVGDDPARRESGAHNAIVWGRAVTNALQGLRGADEEYFERWYAPHVSEMQGDPLLKWFYKLRSAILKAGEAPEISSSHHVAHLDLGRVGELMRHPPPGARSFFMLDNVGGSGWEVTLGDGSVEKYYVALPLDMQSEITTTLQYPDPPEFHLGQPITDKSLPALLTLYLRYLDQLLRSAERTFNSV